MKKLVKTMLFAALGLLALALVGVTALVLLVDPNQYKPMLEEQAKAQAGVNLKLNGALSWSILPLGIHVAEVALNDRSQQHFASLGLLTAELDLWSLIRMKPRVDHVLVQDLDVLLVKHKDGSGNWEMLVDEAVLNRNTAPEQHPEQSAGDPAPSSSPALDFRVQTVQIRDARVQFKDLASAQDVELNPFNLRLDEIALDQDIPVQMSFTVALNEPRLKLDFKLDTQAHVASTFKQFALKRAEAGATVLSALLNDRELRSSLTLDLVADLDRQTLSLPNFALTLNQLRAEGQLEVTHLNDGPQIHALIKAAPFALVPFIDSLGQPAPALKQADIGVSLEARADLKQQTAEVPRFDLTLNNMSATAQLTARELNQTPKLQAGLSIAEFSLAELVAALGIVLPPMQSPDALGKFAFSVQAQTDTRELTLSQLKLELDDATFTGSVLHRVEDQFTKVRLNGDQIDLDRYLPPAGQTPEATAHTEATPPAGKEPLRIELPNDPIGLEPLRRLNLDLDLGLDKARIKTVEAKDSHLKLLAHRGLIQLQDLSTRLLGGAIVASATADARGERLKVTLDQRAHDIAADMDLGQFVYQFALQGKTSLITTLSTNGTSVKSLVDNLRLSSDFALSDGRILGANASALTCEGIALVNGQSISTSEWEPETVFEQLNGTVKMNGLNIHNSANLQAAKMKLLGDGSVDLNRMKVDYSLTTYILGDLGHDACRYNAKFANVGIPIRCQGDLNGIDAKFCLPDKDKLGAMAKELAKQEVKRKTDKEVDRALDKHLGPGDNQKKDAVKNLLKKIF